MKLEKERARGSKSECRHTPATVWAAVGWRSPTMNPAPTYCSTTCKLLLLLHDQTRRFDIFNKHVSLWEWKIIATPERKPTSKAQRFSHKQEFWVFLKWFKFYLHAVIETAVARVVKLLGYPGPHVEVSSGKIPNPEMSPVHLLGCVHGWKSVQAWSCAIGRMRRVVGSTLSAHVE